MTLEPVKCPHCRYKYRAGIEQIVKDGETVAVRFGLSDVKKLFSRRTPKSMFIDLSCPNCKKEFEWEGKV